MSNDSTDRYGTVPPGPGLFELGRTVITAALTNTFNSDELAGVGVLIARHHRGDWGDVDDLDAKSNKAALLNGDRIWSVFHMPDGRAVWVITESDRSATTALLPSDY